MTPHEYKLKHGPALHNFLKNTEAGKDLKPCLDYLRPGFAVKDHPHIHIETGGKVQGYELCVKNLIFLSSPPIPNDEIEMTYGTETKQK